MRLEAAALVLLAVLTGSMMATAIRLGEIAVALRGCGDACIVERIER